MRGCLIENRRSLLLGEPPLRGAASSIEGEKWPLLGELLPRRAACLI